MIKIINTGEQVGSKVKYIVMINDKIMADFLHERNNGLGMCLLEASKAVEKKRWTETYKLLTDNSNSV